MTKILLAAVLATAASTAGARASFAQAEAAIEVEAAAEVEAPVPPSVEQPPAAAPGGSYCFSGPHPVDTRVVEGPAWDEAQGRHLHHYPPFDLRLFVLREGCYHFVGDPTDFGYRGQTYSYYGAHPVLETYGGGWCFMIGGHAHWWRPWSPYFTVAGPWYYWYGPYDPFFWHHWPYYAHYYRAYYPRYYGGGRFYRGPRNQRIVAPPVGRMAARPARAMPAGAGMATPGMSGRAPAPARGSWNRAPGFSASPVGAAAGDVPTLGSSDRLGSRRPVAPASSASTWPAANQNGVPGWDRSAATATPSPWGGAVRTRPQATPPTQSASWPTTGVRTQPRAGFQGDASGWSGSFRSAPAAPSFRSAPAPSFRSAPAPAAPSFRSSPSPSSSFRGGSFRSGGWRR
jgi:hypothetical protein